MDLSAFRNKELAKVAKIRNDIDKEMAALQKEVNVSMAKAKEAANALKNAERVLRNAERNALAAAAPARPPKPNRTRSRRPGANNEIAGRPARFAPGAPLRQIEGKISHPRTLALTRSKRNVRKVMRGGNIMYFLLQLYYERKMTFNHDSAALLKLAKEMAAEPVPDGAGNALKSLLAVAAVDTGNAKVDLKAHYANLRSAFDAAYDEARISGMIRGTQAQCIRM